MLTRPHKAPALWTDPEAMGVPLLALVHDELGEEAVASWEATTLALEWQDEAGAPPGRAPFERLMAALSVHRSDDFFKSPVDFCRVCLAFDGEDAGLPDCLQCAWGMTEALLIRPSGEFSDQVRGYVGAALDREGVLSPPDLLRLGLRDTGELLARARYDFADDPEMFGAIAGADADRTQEINDELRLRLRRMLTQLAGLPRQHPSRARAVTTLLSRLDELSAGRPPGD